jgi:hypothetical protein
MPLLWKKPYGRRGGQCSDPARSQSTSGRRPRGLLRRLRIGGRSVSFVIVVAAMMATFPGAARADDDSTITVKIEPPFSELSYGLGISVFSPVPPGYDKMGVEVRGYEVAVLYPDPVSGLFDGHLSVPASADRSMSIACDLHGMMTMTVDGEKWLELLSASTPAPEDFAQTVQALLAVEPDKDGDTTGCNAAGNPECKVSAPSMEIVIDGMSFVVPVQMSYPANPCI